MNKPVLSLICLAALLCAAPIHAATASKKPLTSQQNRMKTCAAQYHEKKVAKSEYRKFMSQCLRTHPAKAKTDLPKP